MALNHPVILAQLSGFAIFLWLGLYLLVRASSRRGLIAVSVAGLLAQAVFFGSNVVSYTATSAETVVWLERWFWWSAVLPAAVWFHFSSLVRRGCLHPDVRGRRRVLTLPAAVIYTAAAAIVLFGTVSDSLLAYSRPVSGPLGNTIISPGSAYPLYIAYLAVAVVGALAGFLGALRRAGAGRAERALRQQLRLLTAGALVFVVGALWIPSRYYWSLDIPALPGHLCLFGGLGILGYGVAQFGMLLEGKRIQRDFIYNATGIALINLLYSGLMADTGHISPAGLVALVGLVTLTHTAFDSGRTVLDRLFFSQEERTARAEAREYATSLGTAPVPAPSFAADEEVPEPGPEEHVEPAPGPTPKTFKDQVRRAITGLKSPPRLAQSPLLSLELVEQRVAQTGMPDNRLNRAAALREILIEHIEALRPVDGVSSVTGEAWRFYNVLYYPYLRELSRKAALAEARRLAEERQRQPGAVRPSELEQVLSWLADIDEDTFYKWQRRASDTIASLLWEEHEKQRVAPSAPAPAAAAQEREPDPARFSEPSGR